MSKSEKRPVQVSTDNIVSSLRPHSVKKVFRKLLPENSGNTLTKGKPERRLIPDGGIEETADIDRITAEELLRRKRTKLGTEKDHEFRCPICSARCTESASGIEEYGHYTDCPRRPDHPPRGGKKLQEEPKALATDGGDSA